MRTNSSLSTTLFILFNILFSIPTQGQDATPSDPATAPPPSSNPPSPETHNPTPSSPPPSPATAPPPSSPPAALNCSQCRINPIGLAACGLLIKGVVTPNTLRLCCRTLRPLTNEEGAACLCYAIKINTVKISNIDVLTAVDKVLAACSNL